MFKKYFLLILSLSFILVLSSSYIYALNFEGNLNSTIVKNEGNEMKPVLEGNFYLKPENSGFGLGLNLGYSDQYFSVYDIFSRINLNLIEKYNTNLIIGLSQYNGYEIEEEYRGFLLGTNIEKKYNENTTFFTKLNFSFFPNDSLTKIKTGVKYKFGENKNLNLSYTDYDRGNNGFSFGLGFIFGNN